MRDAYCYAAGAASMPNQAAEVLIRSEQQVGDFAALAAEADARTAACTDDPCTNHVLTRAHSTLALRITTPEKAAAQAVRAWRAYRAQDGLKSGDIGTGPIAGPAQAGPPASGQGC